MVYFIATLCDGMCIVQCAFWFGFIHRTFLTTITAANYRHLAMLTVSTDRSLPCVGYGGMFFLLILSLSLSVSLSLSPSLSSGCVSATYFAYLRIVNVSRSADIYWVTIKVLYGHYNTVRVARLYSSVVKSYHLSPDIVHDLEMYLTMVTSCLGNLVWALGL